MNPIVATIIQSVWLFVPIAWKLIQWVSVPLLLWVLIK